MAKGEGKLYFAEEMVGASIAGLVLDGGARPSELSTAFTFARSAVGRGVRSLAIYSLLTIALTWPMALRLHVVEAGDSAFFAWEMGWEIHALKNDPAQLPHANIYHPLRYSLGLDEPVLGTTALVLPLSLFTDDAVWLFNVGRLLTFVLSAFGAYLLARELGVGERSALVGGAAFAFSLIRCSQMNHLSALGTQWLPLIVLFTHRFARTARTRDGALAGLFFSLETLACGYHGLIGAIILPLAAIPLLWGRARSLWRGLLAGLATAAVGPAAMYALHQAALAPQHFTRSLADASYHSASLETFLAAPWWSWLWGGLTSSLSHPSNDLFVGAVPLVIVAIAALRSARERRRPSLAGIALAIMAVGAAVVALGPEIRLGEQRLVTGPYTLLYDLLPVFRMIQVPSRAGAFIALAASMLLAKALTRWEGCPRVIIMCALGVVIESLHVSSGATASAPVIDTAQPAPPVYAWLAQQPGDFPIVELPIENNGPPFRPAWHASTYMVFSTLHWKRLVNGYAGADPVHYAALARSSRCFPSATSIAAFRALNVRYVVLHQGAYGDTKVSRIKRELPKFRGELREVARFGDDRVFALERHAPAGASSPSRTVAAP